MFILVTGERIAMEYLLAQTNRGDLLAPSQVPEIPSQVLEEEDEPDASISIPDVCSAELGAGEPHSDVEDDPESRTLVTEVSTLSVTPLSN